jgi:hypothetical protein
VVVVFLTDLQAVLNAGTYAETDGGNNYIDILRAVLQQIF